MIMILLIVLIIYCFVCLILIKKGIEAQCKEEGRQHRRELYKIWTGHYPEEENTKPKDSKNGETCRSDWREKCCDQCKHKFVEYNGKQFQCSFSKCTDEEVVEFDEHNGCQGIREYLETGNFPERARKIKD